MNCVYIIYSTTLNKFYIGQTEDLENRLNEHKSGFYENSFTKNATDWQLYFYINCESKSQAVNIEKHIKKMKSKVYCKNLKLYPEMVEKLKQQYK